MSRHKMTGRIRAQIADMTGLPVDVVGNAPIFQMLSDRELILEGVRNLEHYDEASARIRTDAMSVEISGKRLQIKCLANRNISVSGRIESITLDRTK